jgi:hypothetical protein
MSPKDTNMPLVSGDGVLFVGLTQTQRVKAVIALLQLLIPILTNDKNTSAKLMLAVNDGIRNNKTFTAIGSTKTGKLVLDVGSQRFQFDLKPELLSAFASAGLTDAVFNGTIRFSPNGAIYGVQCRDYDGPEQLVVPDVSNFQNADLGVMGAGSGTAFAGVSRNKKIISILAMVAYHIATFTKEPFTPPGLVIGLIKVIRRGGNLSVKVSAKTGKLDVTVGGNTLGLNLRAPIVEALKVGGLTGYEVNGTAASNDTLSGDSFSYGFTVAACIDREDLATHS